MKIISVIIAISGYRLLERLKSLISDRFHGGNCCFLTIVNRKIKRKTCLDIQQLIIESRKSQISINFEGFPDLICFIEKQIIQT